MFQTFFDLWKPAAKSRARKACCALWLQHDSHSGSTQVLSPHAATHGLSALRVLHGRRVDCIERVYDRRELSLVETNFEVKLHASVGSLLCDAVKHDVPTPIPSAGDIQVLLVWLKSCGAGQLFIQFA